MNAIEQAPRRPRVQDVSALIGLLAVLEGEVWAGDGGVDEVPDWATRIAERLSRDGLMPGDAGNAASRQVLSDLNQRLRYVLGEHDEP